MQFGVSESVRHWGKYRPNSPAVYHNHNLYSFRELDEMASIVSNRIEKARIFDERVGIAVKSKLHLLIAIIGILRSGKSPVILNIGLPLAALRLNISDTKLSALISDHEFDAINGLPSFKDGCVLDIDDVISRADSDDRTYRPSTLRKPENEWGVIFSSGTTGPPKGIERDQSSIITELLGWCIELQLIRGTFFYIGRPIYYTGGLVLSLSTLLVGGAICVTDFEGDDDPKEIWNDYQKVLISHAVSWAFFVPDQIRAFVKIIEQEGIQRAGAEKVLVMGAPISGEEKAKAAQFLRSKVVESWGNSESLGTITEPEDLQTRPNSIGRPFITDELYVLSEDEKVAEPGVTGRLAGSDVEGFLKYSNRPKETRLVKRSGMIVSDDLGYTDADGYFYILGREQECVIRGTRTIFLGDIEKKLRENQQISDCCVIAKPVNNGVFALVAVIIPAPGLLTDTTVWLDELNKLLPLQMRVDQILVRNDLPHLPSGKQDKVQVAQLIDEVS